VSRPVRIVLVEDNEVFRDALELLLGLRSDVEVVASVRDGNDAVPAVREHEPDVVLMDYRMPGLDGVQATARVRAERPGVAVVCLTASRNEPELEALRAAGAVACLSKDEELDAIVDAIRAAADAPAAA
jgi:DNA-binding NarL/FixJ family response regulator